MSHLALLPPTKVTRAAIKAAFAELEFSKHGKRLDKIWANIAAHQPTRTGRTHTNGVTCWSIITRSHTHNSMEHWRKRIAFCKLMWPCRDRSHSHTMFLCVWIPHEILMATLLHTKSNCEIHLTGMEEGPNS